MFLHVLEQSSLALLQSRHSKHFFFLSCLHFNLIKNIFSRVGFWKGTAQIQSTVKKDMCNFKISFKLKFAEKKPSVVT